MNKEDEANIADVVAEVRRIRQRLVEGHGGLREWVRYLQDRQKERPGKAPSSPTKRPR
jgi:hypothetical protein